jgi:hypothetical protein
VVKSRIFIGVILPVVTIIAIAYVAIQIFTKPIDTLREENSHALLFLKESLEKGFSNQRELLEQRLSDQKEFAEQRLSDIRENEKRNYDSMLSEVKNDKRMFYIIMIAGFAIFLVILLNIVSLLTRLDSKILLYPDRYEVIPKEEAEALKYIKYELVKAKFLTDHQPLLKENVIGLLSPRN